MQLANKKQEENVSMPYNEKYSRPVRVKLASDNDAATFRRGGQAWMVEYHVQAKWFTLKVIYFSPVLGIHMLLTSTTVIIYIYEYVYVVIGRLEEDATSFRTRPVRNLSVRKCEENACIG